MIADEMGKGPENPGTRTLNRKTQYFWASAAIMITQPRMHRLMHRQNQA
jgi:hypothetical protein